MYIIAIGWLWVVLMMAITEPSWVHSLLTFFFYGLAPLALLLWLLGTPQRRRQTARQNLVHEQANKPDGTDSQKNQ